MSDQHQAATAAAGDLELAGTTYRVEHVPGPGGHRVTYLVAPDGEVFILRAYLGASTATILLLALFGWAGLKLGQRVWVLTALLTVLFAVMYLILRSSDYALLAGSTLAFLAIAATMIATRNEDWYGQPRPPSRPAVATPTPSPPPTAA